jgi:hypothetical protein
VDLRPIEAQTVGRIAPRQLAEKRCAAYRCEWATELSVAFGGRGLETTTMRTRLGFLAIAATVALALPATAQQTLQRDGRTATDATRQKPSTQTGQPNASRNVNRNTTNANTRPRPVVTSPTLADQPQRSRENPREKSALDPIALDNNLRLGLETSTKVNTYQFSDGRRIPGLENTTRNDPSYFGLSLSTPTNGVFAPPSRPRLD